jgi:hypothetical protein
MSAEKHSAMLGQIANIVTDFCSAEESTLQAVAKLRALYYEAQARLAWDYVDRLNQEASDE